LALVTLSADLQRYTGGISELEVAACKYQDLVVELRQRFPGITQDIIDKQAIAIDGMVIQTPMLETFDTDSELVFITRIAGG
jgi:hypothetical protein